MYYDITHGSCVHTHTRTAVLCPSLAIEDGSLLAVPFLEEARFSAARAEQPHLFSQVGTSEARIGTITTLNFRANLTSRPPIKLDLRRNYSRQPPALGRCEEEGSV